MNTLYLMEAYDQSVYEPARLSNHGGFNHEKDGDFVLLLDSYSIDDEAIGLVVAQATDQGVSGFESSVLAMAAIVSQSFVLHVRPHQYDSTAKGSFRLVNVAPSEVRVSARHSAERANAFGHVPSCRTITIRRAK